MPAAVMFGWAARAGTGVGVTDEVVDVVVVVVVVVVVADVDVVGVEVAGTSEEVAASAHRRAGETSHQDEREQRSHRDQSPRGHQADDAMRRARNGSTSMSVFRGFIGNRLLGRHVARTALASGRAGELRTSASRVRSSIGSKAGTREAVASGSSRRVRTPGPG